MGDLSKVKIAISVASLAVATLVLLAVFVTSGLAGSANATKYGFKNRTGAVSDEFYTEVTPAGYTFAIWGVIYAWQALWILYTWTFTCRPNSTQTIFPGVYIGYSLVNILNVTWIYVWGNEHVVASGVILIIFNVVFYPTIGLLFGYFYRIKDKAGKVDTVLTYILPMNGLCFYATWTTIASLINLTIAVEQTTSISDTDMATVALTILLVALLTYFVLENTVLDKYGFRYVYSVYPVVVWATGGVLAAHWGVESNDRNNIYTLILLLLAAAALVAKFALGPVYCKFRKYGKKKETAKATNPTYSA